MITSSFSKKETPCFSIMPGPMFKVHLGKSLLFWKICSFWSIHVKLQEFLVKLDSPKPEPPWPAMDLHAQVSRYSLTKPAPKNQLFQCGPVTHSVYPSSHNHGSEKWVPPILLTFQIQPFFTSMIIGERAFRGEQKPSETHIMKGRCLLFFRVK